MSYLSTTWPWQNLTEDDSSLLVSIPEFSAWAVHDGAVQCTTESSAGAIQTCNNYEFREAIRTALSLNRLS